VPQTAARRLAPGDRRRQILTAAHGLLETHSIEEISVETVAAQLGVSPGLLFHYFGTQRDFRTAVIQTAATELLGQMRPDPALSPAAQLHAALDTFIQTVACRPRLFLAVVRYNTELTSLHWNVRAVLADWLTTGLAQAGVPITSAVTATISGWLAFTEEAILQWISVPVPELTRADLVNLCEQACYRLLELAIADPPRWSDIEQAITRPGPH
jgi:AcrR family transcriptional regulator